MMKKRFIPFVSLKQGKILNGLKQNEINTEGDLASLVEKYGNSGADELLIRDMSETEKEHEQVLSMIIQAADQAEIPLIGAGNIKRMEDIKKILYAGCQQVILDYEQDSNRQLLEDASKRFGKEKIGVYLPTAEYYLQNREKIEQYAGRVFCKEEQAKIGELSSLPLILITDTDDPVVCLQKYDFVQGIAGVDVSSPGSDLMMLKESCRKNGIPVEDLESSIQWEDFKLDNQGLIPVVVQDYKTDEVLMLAYMNRDAFEKTLQTGKMTYWSRSRQELWTKGLTSGHVQYVKSLEIDCDNDTILAKVSQIGAACHTGHRSCFYRNLVRKEYNDTNPLRVFQDVYDVILERKNHPKEGSYTNYLFDKGIDKILKKVGEECTEIVIAAKNPDKEEIKYEISDFLYHVMVLMAECDVTWEDITRELSRR